MRAIFLALLISAAPLQAQALSRSTSTVVTTSWYGLAGGTVVGLLAWPLTGSNRSVGIGASIGLWLGLAVGIYHNNHRDDPGNPLRSQMLDDMKSKPSLFPQEWENNPFEAREPVAVHVEVPVLRF